MPHLSQLHNFTTSPFSLTFDAADLRDPAVCLGREWLETNGLGGWAGSTLANVPTRKYHGLLVAATKPPVGREVLLASLHETVVVGAGRYALGGHYFFAAPLPPRYLTGFRRGLFPEFTYQVGGLTLRKTVAALHHENTTVLWYEVLAAPAGCVLEWLPLLAARDANGLTHQNPAICQQLTADAPDCWHVQPYATSPTLYLHLPGATHQPAPAWYGRVQYPEEKARGYDSEEDLFGPGPLRRPVQPGAAFGVIVSTNPVAARDPAALLAQERERRSHLTINIDHLSVDSSAADKQLIDNQQLTATDKIINAETPTSGSPSPRERGAGGEAPARTTLTTSLLLAADQFIVRRDKDLNSVIAGYPWFTDWGRDTMIALPGLCLSTGRPQDAARILRAFAGVVSQGMLPNRFPDSGATPEYNTVDATLWFFVAIYHYAHACPADHALLRDELLPVLLDILAWHERGTRYGIHATPAGLLHAGAPGEQLTWMDAKIGDWVVTPRQGYPVEVQALWYNALRITAILAATYGNADGAARLTARAAQTKATFAARFWNEAAHCLYDCLPTDPAAPPDASLRPNQVLALSLPFPLTEGEQAAHVLAVVESQLLTPVGLRSLAPTDPAYQPYYRGPQPQRDAAYHQGTVWSWLLGPYVDALLRVRGPETGRQQARQLLAGLPLQLREAGVGSISEVFDGAAPHAPGGAIAQAWGVGEVLRVLTTYGLG